jgi:hypothetical protein
MECIRCGGTSFGQGETKDGFVSQVNKIFTMGSACLFTICINCGEVNSIRVKHPEKFK